MRKLIKFEFLKIFTSKLFIYTFIAFFIINILILTYTENLAKQNEIPYSSYKILNEELKNLNENEKEQLIESEYERIYALNIIQNIRNTKNSENELIRDYSTTLKNENIDLYEKYIKEYEAGAKYKYTDDISKELKFLEEIKKEYEETKNYNKAIQDILEKAENLETISIFKTDTNDFSSNNIKDTASKYKKMQETQIDYQVGKGINSFTKMSITEVLIILLVFVISSIIIYKEREKNLFTLIKSTKNGRTKTIIAKIMVLFISTVLVSLIFYLINFIYYGIKIGYGDLSANIQSISYFMYSTLQIQIWQYLIIFIVTKIMAYFIIALIVLLSSTFAKNNIITYITFIAIFAISFVLYSNIESGSNYNVLKYINILNLLEVNGIYKTYLNIKLFGIMQNVLTLSFILCIILILSVTVAIIAIFNKKKDLQIRESYILNKIKGISIRKNRIDTNIITNEAYKLFVTNKVAILILIFLIFQVYNFAHTGKNISFNENLYKSYMEILEGKLTDEKVAFIEKQQQEYENAEKSIEEIENKLNTGEISKLEAAKYKEPYEEILDTKPVFSKIEEKYEYIKEHPKAEFVYDTGYNELLRIKKNSFIESDIYLIAISIICFTSIFIMEYRTDMIKIINTTPKGRKHTAKSKIVMCVIASIIVFMISVIPEIIKVKQIYGFSNINASITSLTYFSNLPKGFTILHYIIIMYLFRLISYISLVLFILWISLKLKNITYTILLSSSLLLIPIILVLVGADVVKNISIIQTLNISKIILLGGKLYWLYFIIPIIVGGMSYKKLCKKFE